MVSVSSAGALFALMLMSLPVRIGDPDGDRLQPNVREVTPLFNKALAAGKADDCATAGPGIQVVIAHPQFRNLEPKNQALAYEVAADCARGAKDYDAAYRWAEKATHYDEADDWVWRLYILAPDWNQHPEVTVLAVEDAARRRPGILSGIPPRSLYYVSANLANTGRAPLRTRLLAALDDADYVSPEPFRNIQDLWLMRAGQLADAGDQAGFARNLGRITEAELLAQANLDRRFFAALDADPKRFDVRAAAERELARDQQEMSEHPELLEGVITVAMDLRRLGRPQEALALIDAAQPKVDAAALAASDKDDKSAFTDLDEELNWFSDTRARVLRDLGRFDEAEVVLTTGAALKENDGLNVSQMLNLAEFYNASGKPQKAIEVLDRYEKSGAKASPYGDMVFHNNRVCADAQLGLTAEMKAAMTYVQAHAADNWGSAIDAALCADDLDAAAAMAVRGLADHDARRGILDQFSDYDPARPPSPRGEALNHRLKTVATRPEVKAAIDKAGRVMTFHIVAVE